MDLLQVYVRMFEPSRDAAGSKKKKGEGGVFYVCYSMLCTPLRQHWYQVLYETKIYLAREVEINDFGSARGTPAFPLPLFLDVFILAIFGFFGRGKGEAPAAAAPSSFFLLLVRNLRLDLLDASSSLAPQCSF